MPTSYSNPGGTGYRVLLIPITVGGGLAVSGSPTILLNGIVDNAFFFNGQSLSGAQYLMFDFSANGGSGAIIDEMKWYQNNTVTQGTWRWQGSNDGISWTNIGGTFTLGGATPFQTDTSMSGNTTAYKYYRLLGVSGSNSSSPWLQEIEFKISGVNEVWSSYFGKLPTKMIGGAVYKAVPFFAGGSGGGGTPVTPVPVATVLKAGIVGTAYSETITANGGTGPYTYTILSGSLPTSTSLSGGDITGTPTVAGTYSFTIKVTDALGNFGTQAFQITIAVPSSGGGSWVF